MYISRKAAAGAISRKSRKAASLPLPGSMIMKPPPPMPEAVIVCARPKANVSGM